MNAHAGTHLAARTVLVDGVPMADSRDIAAHFGKRHDIVLRAIDEHRLEVEQLSMPQNCGMCIFKDLADPHPTVPGRTIRHVLMNRAAFTLVVMSFTGEAALRWKLAYIDAFDAMEREIHRLSSLHDIDALADKVAERLGVRDKVERAALLWSHEMSNARGAFVTFITAQSVIRRCGFDPRNKRGFTVAVSNRMRDDGVECRPPDGNGMPRLFDPGAADRWVASGGKRFVEHLAKKYAGQVVLHLVGTAPGQRR